MNHALLNSPFHCLQLRAVIIFIVIGGFVLPKALMAQDIPDRRAKAVYIDFLGNNLTNPPSVNFDMRFKKKTNLGWGARIGFSKGETKEGRYRKLYHAPVMIYRTTGKQRLMLETGLGATFTRTDTPYHINSATGTYGNYMQRENNILFIGNFGLRAQALKTGAIARIYWSPIFRTLNTNETYLLWFGTSIGFSIK